MGFSFLQPLFIFGAATLVLLAGGVVWARRKPSPALLCVAAALFCVAAAQPVMVASEEPRHFAVLDVSGSMEPRLAQARALLDQELARSGAAFNARQLSDTLRNSGDPAGGRTNYAALSALRPEVSSGSECVLLTDGRGRLEELLSALDPSSLTLLRAPPPSGPDAVILSLRGPGFLLPGASGSLSADVRSDREANVNWRILGADGEVARGALSLKAGVAQSVSHTFIAPPTGLLRLRLIIECGDDREPRNDAASLAVVTGGKRVILYCRGATIPQGSDALVALLASDPLNELREQGRVPASAAELEGVSAVVVNDLALAQSGLTREGLAPLARWVREGGRLMMAGARDAFGPGGWRGSAIEDLMPVTFRPDDDAARRIVLLLDCSDSMRAAVGGQTRLDLLKQAARRVVSSLSSRDFVAIVGFSDQTDALEFSPVSAGAELERRIDALLPRSTTRIKSALGATLSAIAQGNSEQWRVLLITDGENNEAASDEDWRALGAQASTRSALDVVLTENVERAWLKPLRDGGAKGVSVSVGAGGFGEILRALDNALAAAEEGLLDDGAGHGGFEVGGVKAQLALLCRTAPRKDLRAGDVMLSARTPQGDWKQGQWPLLARREMTGRTLALCTPTSGDLWRDAGFVSALSDALGFLLSGAERANLQLNTRGDAAELVWVGPGAAPDEDLRLGNGSRARLAATGRWELAEYPRGDELLVYAGERLLQRMALIQTPPRELALTGDDETFFAVAQQRGIHVVDSLADWKPTRRSGRGEINLTWLAALLASACVLAAFAMRRR